MILIEGFIRHRDVKKQPGGGSNTKFLDVQVVRVHFTPILSALRLPPSCETVRQKLLPRLSLKCSLLGSYNRIHLDDLASVTLSRTEDEQNKRGGIQVSVLNDDNLTMDVSFSRLCVRHTSHNNKQQLYLKFSLVDSSTNAVLSSITSSKFETITRRGIEKQRQKRRRKAIELQCMDPEGSPTEVLHDISSTSSVGEEQEQLCGSQESVDQEVASALTLLKAEKGEQAEADNGDIENKTPFVRLEPDHGVVLGNELVKIFVDPNSGIDLRAIPHKDIVVKFNTAQASVYEPKDMIIMCDTPRSMFLGPSEVTISIDGGKTFRHCAQKFTFIKSHHTEHLSIAPCPGIGVPSIPAEYLQNREAAASSSRDGMGTKGSRRIITSSSHDKARFK